MLTDILDESGKVIARVDLSRCRNLCGKYPPTKVADESGLAYWQELYSGRPGEYLLADYQFDDETGYQAVGAKLLTREQAVAWVRAEGVDPPTEFPELSPLPDITPEQPPAGRGELSQQDCLDLLALAQSLKLKGNQLRTIEMLAEGRGAVSLSNLTLEFIWNNPTRDWNNMRYILTGKIDPKTWVFFTHDGVARVTRPAEQGEVISTPLDASFLF